VVCRFTRPTEWKIERFDLDRRLAWLPRLSSVAHLSSNKVFLGALTCVNTTIVKFAGGRGTTPFSNSTLVTVLVGL
jgi:hypothetical protein